MKRSPVRLKDITAWDTLTFAFGRAAAAKRGRADVEAFRADLDGNLARLGAEIRGGTVRPRPMRRFSIRDPKPRIIHAPCFRDRVLHHALMAPVGAILDRSLVADCYACREGKGAHAAVRRAARHAARAPWAMHVDIAQYFASVDHAVLMERLTRKLRGGEVLALIARLLAGHAEASGRGLPIGALTSQHFANFYLAGIDQLALRHPASRGYVRYMDDMVWWAESAEVAHALLDDLRPAFAALRLTLKTPVRAVPSAEGFVFFCGYRVLPGRVLLSRRGRRRRRFRAHLRSAEDDYRDGLIEARGLQRRVDAALATTAVPVAPAGGVVSLPRDRSMSSMLLGIGADPASGTASCAAARGTTPPGTSARRSATGTHPRTGTRTWASAVPELTTRGETPDLTRRRPGVPPRGGRPDPKAAGALVDRRSPADGPPAVASGPRR